MSTVAISTIPTNPAAVQLSFPEEARCRNYKLAAAVNAGQAVYGNGVGKADLCSTAASGTKQFRGIALQDGAADDVVPVCEVGEIQGFDLSSVAYDALIYAQDTPGAIGTTPGTATVPIGRVVNLTDVGTLTKVLRIRANDNNNW